jgi:hypothetical protein
LMTLQFHSHCFESHPQILLCRLKGEPLTRPSATLSPSDGERVAEALLAAVE